MQINVFISILKRCIVLLNWKRETSREGFEPKRNLSCDSTECFSLLLLSYNSLQNLHKVCVNRLPKPENS